MSRVGVLTVHHEEEVRRMAREVVNAASGFDIAGEAATAEEGLELAVPLRPSLALVGTDMPGIDGFETSRRLLAVRPETTVVLLYSSTEPTRAALAASQSAAALRVDALTPAALRALWEQHRTQ
jgi:DNA-binding NarL/FixJ family response regulator